MKRTLLRVVGLGTVLMFGLLALAAITQFDLATQVKGILAGGNGGTGNGFTAISGPATSLKTFTLPNSSATILTDNAAVTMAQGGTGIASNSADTLLQGTGTAWQAATLPSCSNATTSKLLYSTSTHTFTCGADQTVALNFADNETPSGTVDGSNAVFTIANTASPAGSLKLYKNGQLMKAGGADYTLATATITFVTGAKPQTGDVLLAWYRY